MGGKEVEHASFDQYNLVTVSKAEAFPLKQKESFAKAKISQIYSQLPVRLAFLAGVGCTTR